MSLPVSRWCASAASTHCIFLMLAAFAGFEAVRLVLPALHGTGATPFTGGFDPKSLVANLLLLQGIGGGGSSELERAELEHFGRILHLSALCRCDLCDRTARLD